MLNLLSKIIFRFTILMAYIFVNTHTSESAEIVDLSLLNKAQSICKNHLLIDAHIDWPTYIHYVPGDVSERLPRGHFDYVRAREGGLNAVMSVIWISPDLNLQQARAMVDTQLNIVKKTQEINPDKFYIAQSPDEVKTNFENGILSTPLCLENGSPIGNDLNYIKKLKDLGIAYITLSHSEANQICDANFDTNIVWNGLSPFGYDVIGEMNRLGIMVDISHSTDSTVYQALRYSKAPIIATHSNARYFTPGFERNLPDTLIKAIGANGGVVMVNFGSAFIDSTCLENWKYLYHWSDSTGISLYKKDGIDYSIEYGKTHKIYANAEELVNHIDHVVQLAGIDHVGIGSDFDGIGHSAPTDLPDVSAYPMVVYELLQRGYSENDIRKILGENFLRVWDETLLISEELNQL